MLEDGYIEEGLIDLTGCPAFIYNIDDETEENKIFELIKNSLDK